MPWAGQTVDSKLAGSLGPAAPPRPLLHTFLLPAAASSDTVINSGRGWPLALRIGEAGRSRDGVWCWTLRLGQGVTGFQVARGNFVCLWEGGSARGNHLCRHQEAWQPGAGAGLHLPGAAHCSLRMPRPKGLERGLERRHLGTLGGLDAMSGRTCGLPVKPLPGPRRKAWPAEGCDSVRRGR